MAEQSAPENNTPVLKPCPFCTAKLDLFGRDKRYYDGYGEGVIVEVYIHPYFNGCCLSGLVFDARRWNHRPQEEKLKREKTDLLGRILSLSEKLNEKEEKLTQAIKILEMLKKLRIFSFEWLEIKMIWDYTCAFLGEK
jgi:hypothetical protein